MANCSRCSKISNSQRCTLNAYTTTQTAVAADATLVFSEYEASGDSIVLSTSGTTISLQESGLYYITFNATGELTTTGTTVTSLDGAFYVQMLANGNEVAGAEAAADAQSISSINFSKIVKVNPSCPYIDNNVDITFVNSGAASTIDNMSVVVVRLA